MFGAICGDIIGSRFEFHNIKTKEFDLFDSTCRYTDDSIMTIAVANALHSYVENKDPSAFSKEVAAQMRFLGKKYPNAGYGGMFSKWLNDDNMEAYNSYGNGSAMRVSPVAWIAGSIEEAEILAEASAIPTHNHPEGIKGAKAIASAIYLGRTRASKEEIQNFIEDNYYDLQFSINEIRPSYTFDVTCQGSVPVAIKAFLESNSYEDTIRTAISVGGDSDTIGAIAGSIAEAFYNGVPSHIKNEAISFLDDELKGYCNIFLSTCENFSLDEKQVMTDFLNSTLSSLAKAASNKGWLSSQKEIYTVRKLWETGQNFVAYWMSNPKFCEHYGDDKRKMFYNISTISLLSGVYYGLSYIINSSAFDPDAIFKELFYGDIYQTVQGILSYDVTDLQDFVNEQYRELYMYIDSFCPDNDALEKMLYQCSCAFFHLGCSMEFHDLGIKPEQ